MRKIPEDQPIPWWVYATRGLSPDDPAVSHEDLEADWRRFISAKNSYIDGELEARADDPSIVGWAIEQDT